MPQERPRIAELRRRVQSDPASIAFAQLAEEYRRAGNYQEAVRYCRAGLARHPSYLSARVTLGRALMELGGLEEAASEFDIVLRSAPENLAAIRGMAEIEQRRGRLKAALEYYKRGFSLARFDPDLEETVTRITRELARVSDAPPPEGLSFEEATSQLLSAANRVQPAPDSPLAAGAESPTAAGAEASPQPQEPLIDFDALLASLGVPDASSPPVMEGLLSASGGPLAAPGPVLPDSTAETSAEDPFADLERDLRAFDRATTGDTAPDPEVSAPGAEEADELVVQELEAWLRVLSSERTAASGA